MNEIDSSIIRLHENTHCLMLAAINDGGHPYLSSAPYVFYRGSYYVYLSTLGANARHIKKRSEVSILLIEDEAKSKNVFARLRLNWSVSARQIERKTDKYGQLMTVFERRHGKMVALLKTLGDFCLFELTPSEGRLIIGFGKAHTIIADDAIEILQKSSQVSEFW